MPKIIQEKRGFIMKRKILGLLALWAVLLVMVVGTAAADTVNGALDLVILLDNSGSMYGSEGNDRESFRYDAASIMLNMCEVEGSRAVVYEFSGNEKNVFSVPRGLHELQSIDVEKTTYLSDDTYRSRVTKELTMRARQTYMTDQEGMTPLGTALAKAVEVLEKGAADRGDRQPLILVLADGDDSYNEKTRQKALKKCQENGYKIYTIMLGEDITHKSTLQDMATLTGGTYFELNDASELPKYFSQVLADQTGAELTSEKMQAEKLPDGRWQVVIDVPNRSVQECNIMIPTLGLNDIALTRPNGVEVRPTTDDKIYYFEVGGTSTIESKNQTRFVQYKIMNPNDEGTELGKWLLTFRAEEEESAEQVSVTVVFNYDLTLRTNLDSVKIRATKDEAVVLESMFHTPDGNPSADDMLYRSSAQDEAIVCKAYLVTDPANPYLDESRSLTLKADRIGRKFSLQFSYNDFANITRKSGTYYLVLRAEGDGLIRTSDMITYTVVNEAPQAQKVPEVQLAIHDPIKGLEEASDATIALTDCVVEPDSFADIDLNSIELKSSDEEIIRPELITNGSDAAKATVKLTTRGKAGVAKVSMTVRDVENASVTVEIPVDVRSLMDCLNNEYELKLEAATAAGADGKYQRGAQVELKAEYLPKVAAPTYVIDQYKPEIKLQQINADDTRKTLQTNTVVLEGAGGDYVYEAVLYVNGIALKTTELKLSTGNVAPNVKADTIWAPEAAAIGCEKVPDKWLGHKNTEPWDILFADLFEDGNIADTLTFSYETEGTAAEVKELKENEALIGLAIIPAQEGTMTLKLTAVDDSSEQASCTEIYTVTVFDQNKITIRNCLLILAAIVVLFIVYQVIHAATRPKFKNVKLQVSINNVPQKDFPLSASIKKETMRKYTLPAHQFTGTMAGALEIRPARDGAQIIVKKPTLLRGAEIKVNATKLGSNTKKAVLKRNVGELTATVNGEIMSWKLIPAVSSPASRGTAAKPTAGGAKPTTRSSVPNKY